MQNDERDTPDSPPDEPPSQPSSDEANEFETASWPTEDAGSPEPAADASDASQAAEEPAASDAAAEAGAGAAAAANAEPDTEAAEPPPAEVEAYGAAAASTGVAAHSVPATEPGESTQCPRCGTENRPGIAFCSNCGQRLVAAGAATTVARPEAPEGTQACPRCGTHNRAGVAFCQNCGANLRAAEPGHVPPAAAGTAAAATGERERTRHAVLGPVVLLVGAVGMATGWLLPFALGTGSLYDRAFGDPAGYGIAFWTGYDQISGLASQAYFGFAAPVPILVALLVVLAVAGIAKATPGMLQVIGLTISLVWSLGLLILFVVVEVLGSDADDLLGMLAGLSPAGIIFALSSLIVIIGTLTRFGRG